MTPELSRPVDARHPPASARVEADAAERQGLARRIGIESVGRLSAELELFRQDDAVVVTGRIEAEVTQICAVSGDSFPVRIAEPIALRFVPAAQGELPEELELASEDCDEIAYTGAHIDLGEAVAQTLSLAIDPYATGPLADETRKTAGLDEPAPTGPFAALAQLKK